MKRVIKLIVTLINVIQNERSEIIKAINAEESAASFFRIEILRWRR
jgi:hypothetical protein